MSWTEPLPTLYDRVSTDELAAASPEDHWAFVRGWEETRSPTVETEGIWVEGTEATLHFVVAAAGPRQLSFEAVPYPPEGDPLQELGVHLNGKPVGQLAMRPHWDRYEMDVPAEALRLGTNELVLRFDHALQPAARASGADDRRLAARFRWFRFGSPGSRQQAAPSERRVVAEPEAEGGVGRLVLPADSFLDLVVEVPAGARLVGRAGARRTSWWKLGRLRAEITLQPLAAAREGGETAPRTGAAEDLSGGPDGSGEGPATTLYDKEFPLGIGEEGFDVDLEAWAGRTVRVRLQAVGTVPGQVLFEGPVLTAPDAGARLRTAAALEPPPLNEIPQTGDLGRPDVVLIMLDAARADAFSAWGAPHPTPHVDGLAEQGTRFALALAPSPWTGQTVPAILTGRYPEATGVSTLKHRLPDVLPTLAETLARAGYRTVLYSSHPIYSRNEELQRGFEVSEFVPRDERPNLPDLLPDAGLLFAEDRPTFAFVHLSPPHYPYAPPPPWAGRLSGWYRGDFTFDAGSLDAFAHGESTAIPTSDDVRYVHDLYLENVAYADALVGRVLDTLRRAGRYDNALVGVLSDHGEAFFEHGTFLHTWPLYQELLHVPLVLKWPAGRGPAPGVVEPPVSLIDLFPTLVDGLAPEGAPQRFQGISLLALARGATGAGATPVYAATSGRNTPEVPERPLQALVEGRFKIIHDPLHRDLELYDLAEDPGETHDLSPERPVLAQLLLQRLLLQRQANEELLEAAGAEERIEDLDPETVERLRALGYIQ